MVEQVPSRRGETRKKLMAQMRKTGTVDSYKDRASQVGSSIEISSKQKH